MEAVYIPEEVFLSERFQTMVMDIYHLCRSFEIFLVAVVFFFFSLVVSPIECASNQEEILQYNELQCHQ